MSDVLAITVPIGARYASVNNVGAGSHRGGKKSPEYHRLFASVRSAAEVEIERAGWSTASCDCLAVIVRYVGDRRRHDAMNLGKCEFDALTAAGVWTDDKWANPCMPWIRYDAQGEHRVTIVVVKLYESVPKPVEQSRAATVRAPGCGTSRQPKSAHAGTIPSWKPGDDLPPGFALLNGKLVTRDLALEKAGIK